MEMVRLKIYNINPEGITEFQCPKKHKDLKFSCDPEKLTVSLLILEVADPNEPQMTHVFRVVKPGEEFDIHEWDPASELRFKNDEIRYVLEKRDPPEEEPQDPAALVQRLLGRRG